MEKPDAQLYVGQKAFIEKDGKLLVLHDALEGLDFPGGKVQEGETDFVAALQREVLEETGLSIEVGLPFYVWFNELAPPHRNAGKKVYLVAFRCRYVSGDVVLSHEHDGFRWIEKGQIQEVYEPTKYFEALVRYYE